MFFNKLQGKNTTLGRLINHLSFYKTENHFNHRTWGPRRNQ